MACMADCQWASLGQGSQCIFSWKRSMYCMFVVSEMMCLKKASSLESETASGEEICSALDR